MTHRDYIAAIVFVCPQCQHQRTAPREATRMIYCVRGFAHPHDGPRWVQMRPTATVASRRTGQVEGAGHQGQGTRGAASGGTR